MDAVDWGRQTGIDDVTDPTINVFRLHGEVIDDMPGG